MDKTISFIGTKTKYQMKKVMNDCNNKLNKKKINYSNLNLLEINQFEIINNIISNDDNKNETKEVIKAILNKLSSYKQQDILKEKYNNKEFITFNEVIILLEKCNLNCYYCNSNIYLLYDIVREKKQWTLDRINNSYGHNNNNVVVSCLECNLKRGNTNKEAFLFTKKMKIIREEY